ncbi:MAG TPA: hypothetical protein VN578_21660 [Candidatus Binatia bacterium]|nr:hypothetical protein [Candidatus Binatia bacterium]
MDTADKKEGAELTAEDRAVLTEYLATYEKRARRWRYGRYVTLCFVCLLYFNGFYGFLPAYNDAMTPLDEAAYLDKLGREPIPTDDVTARHWLAGYATKVAVISALERNSQSATLLLGIVGAIMLTVALIGTIMLFNHWNDGERDIVMVKFIRGYVQKQTE